MGESGRSFVPDKVVFLVETWLLASRQLENPSHLSYGDSAVVNFIQPGKARQVKGIRKELFSIQSSHLTNQLTGEI